MKKYTEMNHEELLALKKELDKEFKEIKAQDLPLICQEESQAMHSWNFLWK